MTTFLIKDVRIFTGTSTIESGSVLVRDGVIAEVSSRDITFKGPVFSKPGHTLLPGLIDAHMHASSANPIALPQSLRFGVTTACDLHNEWPNIQKLLRQVSQGDCADLKHTSFAATIEDGWLNQVILSADPRPEVENTISLMAYAKWRLTEMADGS